MIHAISLNKDGLETAIQILSEVVMRPQFQEEEILATQQAVAFELENIHMNPNKEMRMMEMVHTVSKCVLCSELSPRYLGMAVSIYKYNRIIITPSSASVSAGLIYNTLGCRTTETIFQSVLASEDQKLMDPSLH